MRTLVEGLCDDQVLTTELKCCRSSVNSVTASASSTATPIASGSSVNSAVATSCAATFSVSSVAGRVSPLLVDDNSASSCLSSTPVTDKVVHYPKKVSSPVNL